MNERELLHAVTKVAAEHPDTRKHLVPLIAKHAGLPSGGKKTSLGTPWLFSKYEKPGSRLPLVYLIELEGSIFRVAPDEHRPGWRIDYTSGVLPLYEAVNSTLYDSAEDAAAELKRLYDSKWLHKRDYIRPKQDPDSGYWG